MRRYKKLDPLFWQKEKIRTLISEERETVLYLIQNDSCNRLGFYRLLPEKAAFDLRVSPKKFSKLLQKICLTLGWKWDEKHHVICIPTWWKYHEPENNRNLMGYLKDLENVPSDCELFPFFAQNVKDLPYDMRKDFTKVIVNYRDPPGTQPVPTGYP